MTKVRKDGKGHVLHKGEMYIRSKALYSFSYTDAFGKRKCLYSRTLEDLRDKETELQRNKLDKLESYVMAKADINYVFDRYIATKTELRSTTRTNYVYTYDRYVRKGFGKKRISDVRYSEVLTFYNALMEKGLSVSTVESVHSVLHPTLQLAVRDHILRSNPSDEVISEIKKKLKGRPEPRHALSIEQQRAFLGHLEKPEYSRWKPLFVTMFGTGCRVGEIIGLRWVDLDFENGSININHNVTYYPRSDKGYKCEFKVSLPKTEAGIRTVPMLEKVEEALKLEKRNQEQQGYHSLVELDGMSGFIFCNRYGNLHNPASINREIKRIVDDYNAQEEVKAKREHREPVIVPRFSCHITRHTFCTRLCENETNVKVIQSVMGHKDIQTTLGIYAEVSEKKKKNEFDKLNNDNIF